MRNNAPVEHCAAEAFILHREIVLTMKPDFTCARIIDSRHEYSAMKNKTLRPSDYPERIPEEHSAVFI